MKIEDKIRKKAVKASVDFGMINNGDKIIMGISGWKDSMLMAYMLSEIKKKSHLDFELKWVYIHKKFLMRCEVDFTPTEDFFKSIGVELEIIDIDLPEGSRLAEGIWVSCQWCSYARRISLMKLCEKRGYNRIALGHHMDDIVTTFFMNMINSRNTTIMPPINVMKRWDISIIRPLAYSREQEIMNCTKKLEIPFSPCMCPVGDTSRRQDIKKMLREMEEKEPDSIVNIFWSVIKEFKLKYEDKGYKVY